jgi:Fe-S-cluster containining protein
VDFTYPPDLAFECNGCGLCCSDTPHKTRHILLLEEEAQTIAQETGLSIGAFAEPITGHAPYVYEMKKPQNGRCAFLDDANRCRIYPNRPLICHFYPFQLTYSTDQNCYVFEATTECPTIGKGPRLSRKDFEALFRLAQARLL